MGTHSLVQLLFPLDFIKVCMNFTGQIRRDGNSNQSCVFLMPGFPCKSVSYTTCNLDVRQSYQLMIGSRRLEMSDKSKKNRCHSIKGMVKSKAHRLQVAITIILSQIISITALDLSTKLNKRLKEI